jgi:hypothetical protein
MTQDVHTKLLKLWMKLLKASVKRNSKKIAKVESKLIQLELEQQHARNDK